MGNQPSFNQFEKVDTLGEGASCTVYKVKHKKSGQLFALKCLAKVPENKELYTSEKKILELLKGDEGIVNLFNAWTGKGFYYLLLEMASGGDCFDRISGRFSELDASRMTKDMLTAVHSCHKKWVAHRDLKPENFVFTTQDADSKMLLIDFGVARLVKPGGKNVTTSAGSMYYIAPECLEQRAEGLSGDELRASDLWSVGVITFLLLCGYPPFNGHTAEESFRATLAGAFRWPGEDRQAPISAAAKDFVEKLLVKDTKKRMTVEQALAHPWIADAERVANQAPIPKEVLDSLVNFHNHNKLRNAVGRVLAHNMKLEDRQRFQALFRQYDKNGDGKLSKDELAVMFRELNLGSVKEAEMLHQMMDEDHNHGIDQDEFVRGMAVGALATSSIEELKLQFDAFDLNNDGFVTPDEIRKVCSQFLEPDAIEEMVKQVDRNGDGRVDFQEWVAAMRDRLPHQEGQSDDEASEFEE